MQILKTWLFTVSSYLLLFTIISLALILPTSYFWEVGFGFRPRAVDGNSYAIAMRQGVFSVQVVYPPASNTIGPIDLRFDFGLAAIDSPNDKTIGWHPVAASNDLWSQFGFHHLRGPNLDLLLIPFWIVALFLIAAVGVEVVRRKSSVIPPGNCRVCGYDLRHSKARCPECGSDSSDERRKGERRKGDKYIVPFLSRCY